MALISATNLTSAYDGVDRTSYTTASITPTANRMIVIYVANSLTTATPPNSVTGNGITYQRLVVFDEAFPARLGSVWLGWSASPTTGAITIDFGSTTMTSCAWSVDELTNTKLPATFTDAVRQTVTLRESGVTSTTINLATFGYVDNATMGFVVHANNEAITQGSGFTLLSNPFGGTPTMSSAVEFKNSNDQTVDFTFATSATSRAIGIEVINVDAPDSGFFLFF